MTGMFKRSGPVKRRDGGERALGFWTQDRVRGIPCGVGRWAVALVGCHVAPSERAGLHDAHSVIGGFLFLSSSLLLLIGASHRVPRRGRHISTSAQRRMGEAGRAPFVLAPSWRKECVRYGFIWK